MNVAGSSEEAKFTFIPAQNELKLSPDAVYVHMTSNNTIFGTQWPYWPDAHGKSLICDMSSDILSRPFDASQFGLIYAGAQKNLGPSGVAMVVIRKDLAGRVPANAPTMPPCPLCSPQPGTAASQCALPPFAP